MQDICLVRGEPLHEEETDESRHGQAETKSTVGQGWSTRQKGRLRTWSICSGERKGSLGGRVGHDGSQRDRRWIY